MLFFRSFHKRRLFNLDDCFLNTFFERLRVFGWRQPNEMRFWVSSYNNRFLFNRYNFYFLIECKITQHMTSFDITLIFASYCRGQTSNECHRSVVHALQANVVRCRSSAPYTRHEILLPPRIHPCHSPCCVHVSIVYCRKTFEQIIGHWQNFADTFVRLYDTSLTIKRISYSTFKTTSIKTCKTWLPKINSVKEKNDDKINI